ncbi:DUF4231 domain-containing protein [Actinophytocola algeriensis]|uniref:SMODS and SLOG-associating 2TM effector domain-containing protein n=1 Tax=Actinophytocola algeriensis TaxID=1768010 RepID=A0A7W7Q3C4_9PSEU|nr:DUF4231 domain-containing protein [Actinophytocola algeriensis]MBB4906265.1 hypothetical protein [Actinophytocola algeriensis]MBE1472050.1 hypothetical protein [Actinophytocola algeriensis]
MSVQPIMLVWRRQSAWSQASDRLKRQISRSRVVALALAIVGAVLGTAAAEMIKEHVLPGRIVAAAAAVALALASIAVRVTSPSVVRDWTRARSMAEALKSDAYCYLSRTGPFVGDDRDEVALRRLDELGELAGDLVRYITGIEPAERPLPDVHDVDTYVSVRVEGQITGYYRPRARLMAGRVRLARRLEMGLGIMAAAFGAVVAIFPTMGLSAWIGVLTTVATAIAAHASGSRFEYQQIEFTRTAEELERLSAGYTAADKEQLDADEFVQACEQVISIQNESWMVRLSTEHPAT